ncbi:MAG: hypothetical protein K6F21_00255 [Bacteroidales bacterium]|nr:hypothetical protein [Bacteroidales bacterium]
MKKIALIAFVFAAALSCSKAPVVKVTASFTTNKDVYQVGEELLIENTSTVENDILAFCKWEYGSEEGKAVYYGLEIEGISFDAPGLYTVELTAYAEQGAGQDTYTRQIMVIDENDKPWAYFECPASAKVGEEVLFEDKSVDNIGGISVWSWNIGGKTSPYQSPLMVFDAPAVGMVVTLTVTDSFGASDSFTRTIDITN